MRFVRALSSMFAAGLAVLALGACVRLEATAAPADDKPVVVLDTTAGPITIELDPEKAPITVKNFLGYVDSGFYNGLIFHRVMPDFMIQGGALDEQLNDKGNGKPMIKNESANGLQNKRGTIAMARTDNPDSASCQFFINVRAHNTDLDHGGPYGGYAVFGKVIDGMDAVDKIVNAQTTRKRAPDGNVYPNTPVAPTVIKTAKRKAKS